MKTIEGYQPCHARAQGRTEKSHSGSGASRPIPGWKRSLDLFLVIVSSPIWLGVFALCAIWIKLVSKGAVFFKQERIGCGEEPFTIYKFRTMKQGADTSVHEQYFRGLIDGKAAMTKLDDRDPRLIPGGKLLRAAGLDELAQLINVLRGEMSLVGPRPCTRAELEKYLPGFKRRFAGLPGITGSWQVNGKNLTTFRRMIALDVVYLRKLSLGGDLSIILRTFPTVLGQLGALWKNRRERREARKRISPPPVVVAPAPRIGVPSKPSLIQTTAHKIMKKTQALIDAPSGDTQHVHLRPTK